MEAVWKEDTPHARFWKQLLNNRLDEMLSDPESATLKRMRLDHQLVRFYQRRFGTVLEQRGLNLYELIAKACGEVWDDEDEEKGGVQRAVVEKSPPMELKGTERHAIGLDRSRQIGVRQRKVQGDVVQAGNDLGQVQLPQGEVVKGRGEGGDQAEAQARQKKKAETGGGVKKQHTLGLGNVEEGKLADKAKPKKKRNRKRPSLGKAFQIQN